MPATVLRCSSAKLAAPAQEALDRLVRTKGPMGAARALGFKSDTTVNQLMHGGFAKPETVQKMTDALERLREVA